VKKVQ